MPGCYSLEGDGGGGGVNRGPCWAAIQLPLLQLCAWPAAPGPPWTVTWSSCHKKCFYLGRHGGSLTHRRWGMQASAPWRLPEQGSSQHMLTCSREVFLEVTALVWGWGQSLPAFQESLLAEAQAPDLPGVLGPAWAVSVPSGDEGNKAHLQREPEAKVICCLHPIFLQVTQHVLMGTNFSKVG